ncbi:MAG: glycosyl transferase, partial [Alphaproteobacteria bacterium]|nr:glycosyl transferase [Alphaproteobacteria bacterium]
EPSLVFLLGGRTRAAGALAAADDLAAERGRLALVADAEDAAFRAALAARGREAVKLGETSGIDYSRSSRRMTLALYAAGGS